MCGVRPTILTPPKNASRWIRTAVGFAIVAFVGLIYVWKWHSLADITGAIQPVSTASTCRANDGSSILFCDFANHYYPQGQRILAVPIPVTGFYYPAPFALLMVAFAARPYNAALALWVVMGLAFVAGMYLVPQAHLFSRTRSATFVHSLLFATSLPLLHNFVWGQVSVLASLLALVALLAYQKNHDYLAASVLAVAVSVKLYPAIFALYFLIKRDKQTLVVFAAVTLALTFLLPATVLGMEGTTRYYHVLDVLLDRLGHFSAASPYSNNLANVISIFMTGKLAPDGILYQALHFTGLILAGCGAILLALLVRARVKHETYWAAALLFTIIPLVVGTAWVHYFVYLPLVQTFVFMIALARADSPRIRAAVMVLLLLPSAVLSNLCFFLQYHQADDFYRHGYLAWSNLFLLAALYLLAVRQLLQPAEVGRPLRSTGASPKPVGTNAETPVSLWATHTHTR